MTVHVTPPLYSCNGKSVRNEINFKNMYIIYIYYRGQIKSFQICHDIYYAFNCFLHINNVKRNILVILHEKIFLVMQYIYMKMLLCCTRIENCTNQNAQAPKKRCHVKYSIVSLIIRVLQKV